MTASTLTKPVPSTSASPLLESVARSLVFKKLSLLRAGRITLQDRWGVRHFGDATGGLHAKVVVVEPGFYWKVLWGGGLGAAESLMDGDWSCDDLTALVRIFIRNMDLADNLDGRFAWLRQQAARSVHWLRRNTVRGSQRNIHDHYDLGNDFYSLFLDESMNYSCGVFESPAASMHQASLAKMDRICRKLNLHPGDHLLEIGTGWGALAMHAARHYGCQVTTTTISEEQYRFARQRVEEAGLGQQITLLKTDYRQLQGRYSKIVSVEMVEAVGHEYLGTYFAKCADLLAPDGMLLLQSIVIVDYRHQLHLRYVDFIRKYIFPGGCLPSISVLTETASRTGGLRLLQLEDLAPHYAETLRRWRGKFLEHLAEVRLLGFNERFIRMWEYYLCYCEAAFEERQVNDVQILYAKAGCRFDPLTIRCPSGADMARRSSERAIGRQPDRMDWDRSVEACR